MSDNRFVVECVYSAGGLHEQISISTLQQLDFKIAICLNVPAIGSSSGQCNNVKWGIS